VCWEGIGAHLRSVAFSCGAFTVTSVSVSAEARTGAREDSLRGAAQPYPATTRSAARRLNRERAIESALSCRCRRPTIELRLCDTVAAGAPRTDNIPHRMSKVLEGGRYSAPTATVSAMNLARQRGDGGRLARQLASRQSTRKALLELDCRRTTLERKICSSGASRLVPLAR
jgi:hypothetical protein